MPTSRESLITVLYGSSATTAPSDLYDGELAFANGSGSNKKLFIGSGGNNTSNWVGAIIEDQATINWSSVSSENNKLATQYAVKSLAGNYLPLSGGSLTGDLTLGTTSEIVFTARGGGGGTVILQAPTATTSNAAYTFTLPVNDGSAAEVLTTDGNGVLSWSSAGTATNVSVTDDDATTTAYIAFTNATSGATALRVDSDGLTYNASTDTLTIAGDLAVNGGDVTSSATTFNLLNSTVTTLNVGGAATAITMGDSTTATTTIRGGTLVGNTTTQDLFNTTATTVNLGGAATTVSIGAATGTTTINNANTVVTGDLAVNGGDVTSSATTFNLLNSTVTTLNLGGAATSVTIGSTSSGTAHIRNSSLRLGNTTNTITTNTAAGSNHLTLAPYGDVILAPTSTTAPLNSGTFPTVTVNPGVQATVDFAGGDIYLGTKSNDDLSPVVTPVNIIWEGATDDNYETTLTVADPTDDRTITLPNATGTVALVAGSDTQVMFNDGGSALGGDSGLTYNKTTDTLTITGDLAVNGGDITSSATTFNLLNSTVTSLNLGGAATAITMGDSTTATTTIRGGTLVGNTTTQNLFNTTATTVNLGGAATTMAIGNTATAAQTVNRFTASTGASTYNFATGATTGSATKTLNIGTGGGLSTTNINIGSKGIGSSGTTTINSDTINLNGSIVTSNVTAVALFGDSVGVTAFGAAAALTMGATSGTTTTIRGGTLVGNTATQNVFNTTATTVNAFGAATALTMGDSTTATTTLRGGTLVGNTTTQNVFDTTATTVNAFGAATTASFGYDGASGATTGIANGATGSGSTNTINIGASGASGSTTNVNIGSAAGGTVALGYNATVGNNLTVTGDLTVNGTTVTVNTSTLSVEDPLIKLANGNNTADSVDIGFYGLYDTSGSLDLYCGLFRDASDGKFRLFVDSQSEPTTTVNTGATGYTVGTLVANIRGGTFT